MSLLYESARARVELADARDVLAILAAESVDLVVTDPPYGVEWQSRRRAESFDTLVGDGAADRDGIRDTLAECVRVVGHNRHLYIFGAADILDGLKISATAPLIWDKVSNGSGNVGAAWSLSHEPITFAVHDGDGGKGGDLTARLRKGSVLRHPRPTGRKVRHPTEKPVKLITELIESSSRVGELVLDPFAGIGSTGVAAILRGRRAHLIEIDERYARLAVDRIQRAEAIADQIDAA